VTRRNYSIGEKGKKRRSVPTCHHGLHRLRKGLEVDSRGVGYGIVTGEKNTSKTTPTSNETLRKTKKGWGVGTNRNIPEIFALFEGLI